MRQVDFDFLEQRVMDDEFRRFQRSEFDGTDAEFLDHLIDDDDSVALNHDAYVRPRVNPVRNSRGRDRLLRNGPTTGMNTRKSTIQTSDHRLLGCLKNTMILATNSTTANNVSSIKT